MRAIIALLILGLLMNAASFSGQAGTTDVVIDDIEELVDETNSGTDHVCLKQESTELICADASAVVSLITDVPGHYSARVWGQASTALPSGPVLGFGTFQLPFEPAFPWECEGFSSCEDSASKNALGLVGATAYASVTAYACAGIEVQGEDVPLVCVGPATAKAARVLR